MPEHVEDQGPAEIVPASGAWAVAIEEDFAERCRKAREARGISQRELARRLTAAGMPMHQSSIAKMELKGEGRRPLRLSEAVLLAAVLRVPLWPAFTRLGFDKSHRVAQLHDRLLQLDRERARLAEATVLARAEINELAAIDDLYTNPFGEGDALTLIARLAYLAGLHPEDLLADVAAVDRNDLLADPVLRREWVDDFFKLAVAAGYPDLEANLEAAARKFGTEYVFPGIPGFRENPEPEWLVEPGAWGVADEVEASALPNAPGGPAREPADPGAEAVADRGHDGERGRRGDD